MDDLEPWLQALPAEWRADCAPSLFRAARDCHRSPGRHYHTWDHVLDCVEKLRGFPCESPRRAFLALVFHDAVYVPGRKDNEEKSAELARLELGRHSRLPPAEVAGIHRMIVATKHHQADPGERSATLRAVLDIDMSILGADEARYRRYAEGVRREYCPAVTGERRFRIGRLAFLRKLLGQPRIFSTDEGVARWEEAARRNVAAEIARLASEQGLLDRIIAAVVK